MAKYYTCVKLSIKYLGICYTTLLTFYMFDEQLNKIQEIKTSMVIN